MFVFQYPITTHITHEAIPEKKMTSVLSKSWLPLAPPISLNTVILCNCIIQLVCMFLSNNQDFKELFRPQQNQNQYRRQIISESLPGNKLRSRNGNIPEIVPYGYMRSNKVHCMISCKIILSPKSWVLSYVILIIYSPTFFGVPVRSHHILL